MECKYCGKEMTKGRVETSGGNGVFFMPTYSVIGNFPTTKKIEQKGGVVLDGPYITRFNSSNIPANLCKECRKIVIDIT